MMSFDSQYESDVHMSYNRAEDTNASNESGIPSSKESSFAEDILPQKSYRRARRTKRRRVEETPREQRRRALRTHYSDRYLDLFRQTFSENISDDDRSSGHLPTSQLGAVTWQSEEKSKLYHAVSRLGRHDLANIADSIGSKSVLEVREYLSFVRQEEADRHSYARRVENVSLADIPAAIEVGPECEAALSQAADALAAIQDQYDNALDEQKNEPTWVINHEAAEDLDSAADEAEEQISEDEDGITEPTQMFRLANWIGLSERLFMNPGEPNLDYNWRKIAFEGESPAVTKAVVTDFHELAVSLTRRLVQSSIFLAQSRVRSLNVHGYLARKTVKKQDVLAATNILGIESDLWVYFTGVPRRNHLSVITDSHRKGSAQTSAPLLYEVVEALLAVRNVREYRSRSATTDPSSNKTSDNDSGAEMSTPEVVDSAPVGLGVQSSASSSYGGGDTESSAESDGQESGSGGSLAGEVDELVFHASTTNQRRRQIKLEQEQDAYLEGLDKTRSEHEESRLWQVLGKEAEATVKAEPADADLGPRPKVLRKVKDDLRDWTAFDYESAWEHFGAPIPDESFVEVEARRKRLRLYDT